MAIAPTFIVVSIALGWFVGGDILRRKKRGRPDTWLYRQLQWRLTISYPLLAGGVRGQALVTRTGYWTIRRGVHLAASKTKSRPRRRLAKLQSQTRRVGKECVTTCRSR